jgi:hypothetical protein
VLLIGMEMMEREQNSEGHPLANFDLAEPHFNDERTIQTARPVVPLNPFLHILTKQRLALAGAFVLAALLGAGSALAIIQLRQPAITNLSEAAQKEETNQEPVAEVKPTEDIDQISDESVSVDSQLGTPPGENVAAQRPTRRPRHTRAAQDTTPSMPRVTISIKTNDSNPQARLVDEWQESRQRRVARPERPNNHHKRDLFRIREIFEGPRPRRP